MLDLNTKGLMKKEIDEIKAFLFYQVSDNAIFLSQSKVEMFDSVIKEAQNNPYITDEEIEILEKEKEDMIKHHDNLVKTKKFKETVMSVYKKLLGDIPVEELEKEKDKLIKVSKSKQAKVDKKEEVQKNVEVSQNIKVQKVDDIVQKVADKKDEKQEEIQEFEKK